MDNYKNLSLVIYRHIYSGKKIFFYYVISIVLCFFMIFLINATINLYICFLILFSTLFIVGYVVCLVHQKWADSDEKNKHIVSAITSAICFRSEPLSNRTSSIFFKYKCGEQKNNIVLLVNSGKYDILLVEEQYDDIIADDIGIDFFQYEIVFESNRKKESIKVYLTEFKIEKMKMLFDLSKKDNIPIELQYYPKTKILYDILLVSNIDYPDSYRLLINEIGILI